MKVIQLPEVTEKMTVDPEAVSISPDSGGWLSLEQAHWTHGRKHVLLLGGYLTSNIANFSATKPLFSNKQNLRGYL